MLDLETLESLGLFRLITLEKDEILFDEGGIDNNIYIVKSGELRVEKKLKQQENITKNLAILKKGKIFGEGALNGSQKKEARIIADTKSVLLKINAQKGVEEFVEKNPKKAFEFLKYIILLGNKRVERANKHITSVYEMNNNILNLESVNIKSICGLIDSFKDITRVDYIIFLEKNPVLDTYFNLHYDTRHKGKIENKILEIADYGSILRVLLKEGIEISNHNIIEELRIGKRQIGYFILGKGGEDFEGNDKKIITSITNSLSGVIGEKKILDEERDKKFMDS